MNDKQENSHELTEHFFRTEYGKIVSVITRYIGTDNVETAEDIVQETLLKASDYWQLNGIPKNPRAWLYTTAKNLTLNILKRKKYQLNFEKQQKNIEQMTFNLESLEISESITDEQLKMMFVCCHPSISENSQIALILKILCGFSIPEIANAFFSTPETINKRLVRGRKQLRKNKVSFNIPPNINENLQIVLKTIYILFNEGYSPSRKNKLVRYDLCLEAIRLSKIILDSKNINKKSECYSLLALMHLNTARFEARINSANSFIEMQHQDRAKWNQELINDGIQYLNQSTKEGTFSLYLILATISAHHCLAKRFEETNWEAILTLYDQLMLLEDSPITRLNRSVALAKVKGNKLAIKTLLQLASNSDIANHYLFYATLGTFYAEENDTKRATNSFKKAIFLAKNRRDIDTLKEKLITVVPIS